MDGFEIEFFCERSFIHHPGQVGGLNLSIDDRPGDAETGLIHGQFRLGKKLLRQSLG